MGFSGFHYAILTEFKPKEEESAIKLVEGAYIDDFFGQNLSAVFGGDGHYIKLGFCENANDGVYLVAWQAMNDDLSEDDSPDHNDIEDMAGQDRVEARWVFTKEIVLKLKLTQKEN